MTEHCSVNPVLVEAFLMKADGKPSRFLAYGTKRTKARP